MSQSDSDDPNFLLQQAFAHHQAGRLGDAEALYRRLLAKAPKHPDALHLLGLIRMDAGAYPEALALIGAACRLAPTHPILLNNLGECQRRAGDLATARGLLEQALSIRPDYPEAHHNLGKILAAEGDVAAAAAAFRRALAGLPNAEQIWIDLADSLQRLRRPGEALDAYRRALSAAPASVRAANLLAMTLKNSGRVAEACVLYETVLARSPDPLLVSNYLLSSCYLPDLSPADLRQRHEHWGRRLWPAAGRGDPQGAAPPGGRSLGDFPSRPVIGFVSGDFRVHAMRFFIEPLLAGLRKCGVALVGYHANSKTDLGTEELRPMFDVFRQVDALDDDALEAVIRGDGVDVLIDLSGHTGHHRLGVFARHPAPLQLSWIGYLATTGLAVFDAHLTDRIALPPPAQDWFSEPLAYLPNCQWCYRLPDLPDGGDVPRAARGDIVFGGFHMPTKLNSTVLDAWAELLRRCSSASLVLMGDDLDHIREQLERRLGSNGSAGGGRVRCLPAGSLRDYLRAHAEVDLMLDAFPYSGGTTTFHSLAMGVPVLTCAVDHPAGRGGASILSGVGLPQFITGSVAEYIETAVGWVSHVSELREMRATVRDQLARSPLADGDRFAADFLTVVAGVWGGPAAVPD